MKWNSIFIGCLLLVFTACGTSKNMDSNDLSLKESLMGKNRATISLLDQIRQMPGIVLRNGVPAFAKTANTFTPGTAYEPLYVLDDYIVGNSFRSVDQLISNANIKKIETITGPDASFYGSRGANGVIKITTLK